MKRYKMLALSVAFVLCFTLMTGCASKTEREGKKLYSSLSERIQSSSCVELQSISSDGIYIVSVEYLSDDLYSLVTYASTSPNDESSNLGDMYIVLISSNGANVFYKLKAVDDDYVVTDAWAASGYMTLGVLGSYVRSALKSSLALAQEYDTVEYNSINKTYDYYNKDDVCVGAIYENEETEMIAFSFTPGESSGVTKTVSGRNFLVYTGDYFDVLQSGEGVTIHENEETPEEILEYIDDCLVKVYS